MSEAKNFPSLPKGTYFARIYQVIDLGTQETKWGDKRQFSIRFETPTKKTVFDEKNGEQPFSISTNVNFARTSKDSPQQSKLNQIIEAVGMNPYAEVFNIFDLVGKTCMVSVAPASEETPDSTYYSGVSPLSEEAVEAVQANPKKYAPINEPKGFYLDAYNHSVFESLGKKTKEKIQQSLEYINLKEHGSTETPAVVNQDLPDPAEIVEGMNVQMPF